ncbi:MAG: glycerate kinase, partial [Planctomycetes bacterium]|nr:glycerate kinase [Planctomycetota bacterium]
CRAAGVPPVAIAGALSPGASTLCGPRGFAAVFSAQPGPGSLDDALASAGERLSAVAEQVTRLFSAAG